MINTMAKFIDQQDFEPIETSQLDSATDAIETATGLTQDAMQDATPSVDGPVSFAEAARLLGANESTLRKRWWPRVLEACQGTTIEPIALVGHTKAGNPIARVSPAGFGLLQTFALIAGDVEAIARWIERTRVENAIDDADEALGDVEPIEPEIEPIAPWEPTGALAIVPSQSAAIAVNADWVRGIDEGLEADWAAIAQHQTDLSQTLATGGDALSQAMRRVALAQLTEANAVYQQTMAEGVKAIVSGNLAAVTGQGQPPGDRSSAA
jgi:hypothetical protein